MGGGQAFSLPLKTFFAGATEAASDGIEVAASLVDWA